MTAGNDTGTDVTEPAPGDVARAGIVTVRVTPPALTSIDVGTECSASVASCRVR